MSRPKFAIGEVVNAKCYTRPDLYGVEILDIREDVNTPHPAYGEYTGYSYKLIEGFNPWAAEPDVRKRPDLREPFSLEALKEKYAPQREEA